jgi:phage/plasmid primase-like uncharacterized protein
MPRSREELKARMMQDAEEMIDKLLDEKKRADEITLSEIEQAAVETGTSFQQAVVQHLVEDSQGETSDIPICPGCGEKLKLKGHRKRRVETEAGEVELKRPYYYCQACRRGLFPPG